MADKIFEDSTLITKRFFCDCLFPGHILDVSIELTENGSRVVQCSVNLYMDGKAPWRYRMKQMWRLLRGEEGALGDFILRTEDIPELIRLLSRIDLSSWTAHT